MVNSNNLYINNLHSATRNLMMSEERADTYEEAKEIYDEIVTTTKEGITVFREVIKTCKVFLPKKPRAVKAAAAVQTAK